MTSQRLLRYALSVLVALMLVISPLAAQALTISTDPDIAAEPAGEPAEVVVDEASPTAEEDASDLEDEPIDEAGPVEGAPQKAAKAPAAAGRPEVGVTKESSVDGDALRPGSAFIYTIAARCSGLTEGCVNQTVVDILPEGLDVTSLPADSDTRTVDYQPGTRTLTVTFIEPLQAPVGELGLNDGTTRVVEIGMRLPADTTIDDGAKITNTATTDADNADPASADNVIDVSVPVEVKPVATKTWTDGSAVAGSGETSVLTLGARNASSRTADVTTLRITEDDADTFEHFDVTALSLTRLPAGADTARVRVCTAAGSDCDGGYQVGAPTGALGALPLPAGVSLAAVTAFQVDFYDASGARLPVDATGGTVTATLKLRDTLRSSGDPIEPTQTIKLDNCVRPEALDAADGVTTGAAACASYRILPDTIVVSTKKSFFADANGDFTKQTGEHAVFGEESPVSATVQVQNKSDFPLGEIRIVEPDPLASASVSEFEKLDVTSVRLRLPNGATSAALTVTYDSGLPLVRNVTAGTTVPVADSGRRVTKIEVVYTGDAAGEPTIRQDATAYLDLHGTLNASVDSTDLADGVGNCASYEASARTINATGTASGNACDTLTVEAPNRAGTGIKSVGQGDVPANQPIPFTMRLRNSGNLALAQPTITDPAVDGTDQPVAAGNPFTVLRLTAATVRKDAGTPAVAITVFDPDADSWVAYDETNTALLSRATGVRATVAGDLAPSKSVYLDVLTERRDGVADGVSIRNCMIIAADNWTGGAPVCAAEVRTAPSSTSASLNKSIAPGQLPRPIPGLPKQTAVVSLKIANTGNMNASRLQILDEDEDFFDSVDFAAVRSIRFPGQSDRVQIDVRTSNGWVDGTPQAPAASYLIPATVQPSEVVGLRVTFTSTQGFAMRPCEGSPTPGSCTGEVALDVNPRQTLRSQPSDPIPDELENSASGGFETLNQSPGSLQPIPPTQATLELVAGDPELDVEKTPDSAIAPGERAPFKLIVTNSGTTDLPGLVVRDLMPPGLDFDDTFIGDDGNPFRIIDTDVPDGTDPVPAPTFQTVTDGARTTELEWRFGDWVLRPGSTFTIEIRATLAPGAQAGAVSTNTLGASSTIDGLICAPGTGAQVDGAMGPGRYCTDTAAVTTKAGASFQARKWVAGTDALGWFNDRADQVVPVGDPTCPSYTEAGRTYTANPCVALVNPGDEYDYLLRMVNAGTEPATEMRIIDRFPVLGDTGVVLDQTDRGTEWANRPTLASEPTLRGTGSLRTTYTNSESGLCTDDLDMGSSCGAGTWADPYGPAAVGSQMRVDWAAPLAPGAGVSIVFSMRTPLDVPRVADPTVAWNSFGHAEKTQRGNGSLRVLPPTEPIRVGVATAYGTLEVRKELGVNPGDLPVSLYPFGFYYRCTITPVGGSEQVVANGSLTVRPGEAERVEGVPAGAECLVWETDTGGAVSDHPVDDPARVVISPRLGATSGPVTAVTITNSYPLAELSVRKQVTGAASAIGELNEFTIAVTCTYGGAVAGGFPKIVSLSGSESKTVDVPVGVQCTAEETDAGGATSTQVSPAGGVEIVGGAASEIVVTNTFDTGRLQILKKLTGSGAGLASGPFTFTTTCTFAGQEVGPFTTVLSRSEDLSDLVGEVDGVLPVGASCVVTETVTGGADDTPPPVTVTIPAGSEGVTATFTNAFSAGTVSLLKKLAGDGATKPWATDADYTVDVVCSIGREDQVLYSETVTVRAGELVQLTDATDEQLLLPLGARCWATESGTGGATSHSVNASSYDDGLVVVAGDADSPQELALEVTNTFDLSSVELEKVVLGDAAGLVTDRDYKVALTCVLPQDGKLTAVLTDAEYVVSPDKAVVVDGLPVGAQCWARETDTGGATVSVVDHAGPDDAAIVPAGESATITVTNTFEAGELTVSKRVVGPGSGIFTFEVACETDQGSTPLPGADARFRLRAGESRTIQVPRGATCKVTEVDVPRAASVSFDDSDRADDGEVRVAGEGTVTVINTFQPSSVSPDGDVDGDDVGADVGPGGLAHTGALAALLWLAGILVLCGAWLLVMTRRRRSI